MSAFSLPSVGSPPPPALTLTVRRDGDRAVVAIEGEVDHANCDQLRAATTQALAAGATTVVADCGAMTFIDAGGLGVLREVATATRERGGHLTVRHAAPATWHLLTIAGFADRVVAEP